MWDTLHILFKSGHECTVRGDLKTTSTVASCRNELIEAGLSEEDYGTVEGRLMDHTKAYEMIGSLVRHHCLGGARD